MKKFEVTMSDNDFELLSLVIGDPDRFQNPYREETDEEIIQKLFYIEGNRELDLTERVTVKEIK